MFYLLNLLKRKNSWIKLSFSLTDVSTEIDTKDDFDYLEYQLEKNPAVINLFKS